MGVYLCLGQAIYESTPETALMWSDFKSFHAVQEYMQENDKVLILLGVGQHKIKKKAEQEACESALKMYQLNVIRSFLCNDFI